MHRYAGFWSRLGAALVDGIVLAPLVWVFYWLQMQSRQMALLVSIPGFIMFSVYGLYFHARWGQTLGKMVLKIKVLRTDGSAIGWREALLRNSVDLSLSTVHSIGHFIALLSVSNAVFEAGHAHGILSKEYGEYAMTLAKLDPLPGWILVVSQLWMWSEIFFIMFNKRKRAPHDYIAGTIVVHTGPKNKT